VNRRGTAAPSKLGLFVAASLELCVAGIFSQPIRAIIIGVLPAEQAHAFILPSSGIN